MDKINKKDSLRSKCISIKGNPFSNTISMNQMSITKDYNKSSREPSIERESLLSKKRALKINQKLIPVNKKGASVIIGYILLITFGLVMSGIAYNYLKTYVPSEIINCPDDASLFIKEYSCNNDILNVTIKNNGKFNLDGFIIYSAPDINDEIGTDNLNLNFINDSTTNSLATDDLVNTKYIKFHLAKKNNFKPTQSSSFWFNLSNPVVVSNLIEITPTIIKEEDGKINLALCSNAQIRQKITCT